LAIVDGFGGSNLSIYTAMARRRTLRPCESDTRAAISIPSNIAEGKGRSSDREFIKFLNYARGSVYELQTQIKIALRLNYLSVSTANVLENKAAEVGRVLNGLIRAITNMEARAEEFETSGIR
jgi:four helix bundle protein